MKHCKIFSLILALLLSCTSMIGCSSNIEASKSETPYYKLDIDAEKYYYPETYEEVSLIKNFISDFYSYAIETDYRNDEYLKQLDFYTAEIRAIDKETNYQEVVKEMTVGNELIRNLTDCGVSEIEFYTANDSIRADAICYYSFTLLNGTPEYLETVNQEIGEKYKTTAIVELEKQNDGWKLIQFSVIDRVKES